MSTTPRDDSSYSRSDTGWFANCHYGVAVHWTALTTPRHGPRKPFREAVRDFDLDVFVDGVLETGADYVLFTATHALQMLPCPNPVAERVLPGRTSQRDLLEELALRLDTHGKRLLVYYNHSCNQGDDPEWEHAVGYHGDSKDRFVANLEAIVRWMGEQYGTLLCGWWFDSCYSVDPRGPSNSVSCQLGGFQFPWERFTEAARAGWPDRPVAYNAGVNRTFLYTDHQDYWAGEMVDLSHPPENRHLKNGLQWHGWTCLDDRRWVHDQPDTPVPGPLYSDEEVLTFVRRCIACQAPMTFNVGVYQNGLMARDSIRQLARLNAALRE